MSDTTYTQYRFEDTFSKNWTRSIAQVAKHPTDAIGFAASDEFMAWSSGYVDAVIAIGEYELATDLAWLRSVWIQRVHIERTEAITEKAQ